MSTWIWKGYNISNLKVRGEKISFYKIWEMFRTVFSIFIHTNLNPQTYLPLSFVPYFNILLKLIKQIDFEIVRLWITNLQVSLQVFYILSRQLHRFCLPAFEMSALLRDLVKFQNFEFFFLLLRRPLSIPRIFCM